MGALLSVAELCSRLAKDVAKAGFVGPVVFPLAIRAHVTSRTKAADRGTKGALGGTLVIELGPTHTTRGLTQWEKLFVWRHIGQAASEFSEKNLWNFSYVRTVNPAPSSSREKNAVSFMTFRPSVGRLIPSVAQNWRACSRSCVRSEVL